MNLDKDFLCDVICIVAIAQDAIADAVDPGCVVLDDLTKSRLIASLQARYQLSVIRFALLHRRFVWPDAKGVCICRLRRGREHICRFHSSHQSEAHKELRGSLPLEVGESLAGMACPIGKRRSFNMSGVPHRTSFKYAIIALRSIALSTWKAMSLSGTNLSGPASHLSSEAASQVICELFRASE